mmetsp:Transcript_5236/g.17174  ORF Transcript_5236/g.17174 Transcript_5236/m.17174 type:complete len:339 (-) Transcript_5236:149-1165(-)|eukprot:CAMPEP_0118909436 /NCGR_PEP_ID=MMETSP1166-20130328/12018_1 /TAXON_ID=1104430 /ORGANISM="Chrysoreinhardia sp, Strain CCMP3193" /LENGTH=338 /DNA_ID=CAMNT_0006848867 /DNA_START=77 /DNA_END=1093 /DNA_ORIENTATION=-
MAPDDDDDEDNGLLLCDLMDALVAPLGERRGLRSSSSATIPTESLPLLDDEEDEDSSHAEDACVGGPRAAAAAKAQPKKEEALRDALAAATASGQALRFDLRRAQETIAAQRRKLGDWSAVAAALVNAVILSPHRTVKFADLARELLTETIRDIDFIDRLRWIHCSFPATAANAPEVRLETLVSPTDSVWDVRWRPVWSVDVSVDVTFRLVTTLVLLRVSSVEVAGKLRLQPSEDCAVVRAAFLDAPDLDLAVSATLSIGGGSITLRELNLFEDRVKREFATWLQDTLVEPNSYVVNLDDLKRDKYEPLSESDLQTAMRAAADAAERARDDAPPRPVC